MRRGGALRRWWVERRGGDQPTVLSPADGYRRWAETYADEVNELQHLEAELRADLLPDPSGCRTLEVGAGAGRVTGELRAAGAEVIAVDLVVEMLRRAADGAMPAGRTCVAGAEALPFADASFDLVVSALTLGHVADLRAALAGMVDCLRPGGLLVVTDFHPEATARGWQRSFSSGGETLAVEQHAHGVARYQRILGALDCPAEKVSERRWEGMTVVLGIRARKAPWPRNVAAPLARNRVTTGD